MAMTEKAIYYDASKCSACKACQVSCKTWNQLPSPLGLNAGEFTGSYQNPPDLDDNVRLIITFSEKAREGRYGVDWAFGRRSCMHCTEAGCVEVCPSGALFYTESGMVSFDTSVCIGCKYCVDACPFDVPRHVGGHNPFDTGAIINKCTGCVDRIEQGRSPACVFTCQPGALQFGERDDMIKMGEERVAELKEKGFSQARLYGKDECGGLHSINVLKYGIEQYELPDKPKVSGLVGASQFMKPLTGVGAVGIVAGLGLCLAMAHGYSRHHMRYDEAGQNVVDVETGEVIKHIDKEAGER